MKLTYEQKLILKDERNFKKDPLKRLNKAQTKRLEEAYFAKLKEENEEYVEELYKKLNLN